MSMTKIKDNAEYVTVDMSEINKNDEYVTVAQLAQRYPAFSEGSIRWMIFNANTNGFHKVIRRIGRKVVLNLTNFKKFLEENTQK